MACAYAKHTSRLGVCLATLGPGGLHLSNGLYDAKLGGAPVLGITGHHYHDLMRHACPAGHQPRPGLCRRGRLRYSDHGSGPC